MPYTGPGPPGNTTGDSPSLLVVLCSSVTPTSLSALMGLAWTLSRSLSVPEIQLVLRKCHGAATVSNRGFYTGCVIRPRIPSLDICKNVTVNLFSTTVSITHRSPGLVSKQLPCLDLPPTKQNKEEDDAKQQSVKQSCETCALTAFF